MPITYHLQNLTYLSEHETKKNILPSHLLTQHSNTLLLNYRTCTELSHIQDSYGKSILPTVRIGKCQRKGRGGERRRKRRRRRRRGWWCQKEERGRVNRKITVDKGVGVNHEMDWRKLTCDLRFITPTSVDSSKRDRGIKMVSNCSHLLYTRISLH